MSRSFSIYTSNLLPLSIGAYSLLIVLSFLLRCWMIASLTRLCLFLYNPIINGHDPTMCWMLSVCPHWKRVFTGFHSPIRLKVGRVPVLASHMNLYNFFQIFCSLVILKLSFHIRALPHIRYFFFMLSIFLRCQRSMSSFFSILLISLSIALS